MVLSTSAGASYRFNENKMESIQGLNPSSGKSSQREDFKNLHLALSL